jgi:ABC-type thiamine transport system ATPase subunit
MLKINIINCFSLPKRGLLFIVNIYQRVKAPEERPVNMATELANSALPACHHFGRQGS